jgi:hypothetical protein
MLMNVRSDPKFESKLTFPSDKEVADHPYSVDQR